MKYLRVCVRFNNLASDLIRLLEILDIFTRGCANVARWYGKWGTDVDWKSHFMSTHKTRQREVN